MIKDVEWKNNEDQKHKEYIKKEEGEGGEGQN